MVFASWISDQFFGGIGWLILFAAGIHLLARKYGDANPTVRDTAKQAVSSSVIKLIGRIFKK